ncbi:MAG: HAD hydrolase-like protein [Chloroflexi bacterium]|nr:HAD hydrolase-like protein [Chloroflexota bacterium]
MPKRLILFDIDGTLLWTGGAGSAALRLALERVYGSADTLDNYDPGGRTIKEIMDGVLGAAGVSQDVIQQRAGEFHTMLVAELQRLLSNGRYRVEACPGGWELVTTLAKRPDATLGLLTGNPEATARIKLVAAGYDPAVFCAGAFGDESGDRRALLRLAIQRSQVVTGETFDLSEVVALGDTARDVRCGQAVGVRTLAVATGGDDHAHLVAAQPDHLYKDLTDLDTILQTLWN